MTDCNDIKFSTHIRYPSHPNLGYWPVLQGVLHTHTFGYLESVPGIKWLNIIQEKNAASLSLTTKTLHGQTVERYFVERVCVETKTWGPNQS